MRLFHISHTDLDGYFCHLLTKSFFKKGFFLNVNYGAQLQFAIKKVLKSIEKLDKKEPILFLITDLNLTYEESKQLNKDVNFLKKEGFNINLKLLDHHINGQKSENKYEWYFLDVKRCASKITYDYMCENFPKFNDKDEEIKKLVNCVNAVDIWLEEESFNFEFGKVLLSMISGVREINSMLFPDLNRDLKLFLLEKATLYLNIKDGNIKLDANIHKLKKEFLNTTHKDDTLDNLSAKYLVNSLNKNKEELTLYFKGYKGLLTYTLGSISIPANAFLKANPSYDFFIDIGRRGNASFRANGKIDVSLMAQKLANGGGHVNASGAKFEDFKELNDYKQIKSYLNEKLKNIEAFF